ncbi:hypothetical protein M409DRAFT_24481 [Zasmidium cellare ATCC 36951]|uniref:60S ribosomal subunit assembly/export protein LOC1 n=1 Tax=Zasmidium cellare ATCC 36951 TaxID=1080233 RepID=A0A6A6CDC5_ZASCE|nr:uncharacterized protein M409DRAFT_24481 [Zasmidium cellare ATCC 36951]KAF2165095.1 hypothetical protein M409DRAFT_24481 [Zasmidium cellare ATCC 36951]
MPPKAKAGAAKGASKRSTKPSQSGSSSKGKKKTGPKPAPTQHKPKPNAGSDKKKKPPHMRYTEKELKIPQLNGIRPAGVQKPPNAKKGKNFVDDKESMNAIMAMVMAEKEGNLEGKMMRARQMEEVREAKKLEAEKRAQSKKDGLEGRKEELKKGGKKRRKSDGDAATDGDKQEDDSARKTKRKRVSFG